MDPKQQASEIYDLIRATSADRPFAFQSAAQMYRDLFEWRRKNPALVRLQNSSAEVQIEFLRESVQWLKAESKGHANFRVASTMADAISYALEAAPKPLPADLVLKLLTDLRESTIARFYFPFDAFLAVIKREQVTPEIRGELRKLHLQYAPSPTGKIDERMAKTRNLLAGLMHTGDEASIPEGRGPWSHIVFQEIEEKDPAAAAAWKGLLEHGAALEQTVAGAKWKKRAQELIEPLGEKEVFAHLERWLALGPTPGEPPEARSPIEDSPLQKGAVWLLALSDSPQAAAAIGDFGAACLRKIPMLGAVSQKVGFACVQALGSMESNEAIAQLARLRARVKYAVALKLIDKSLNAAAGRRGISVDELEDFAAPHHGLDAQGKIEIAIGDASVTIEALTDGSVRTIWRDASGKIVKSPPAAVKKSHAAEVKRVSVRAKELERDLSAQRYRLDSAFVAARSMPCDHWQKYYVEHPLLGFLGRRLIWVFSNDQGWERSGVFFGEKVCDARGEPFDIAQATKVRLWHPLSSGSSEIREWRDRIFALKLRQPLRQAFREFYQPTETERGTKTHSNRFAGTLMRQHQFASLCRDRGWQYKLMGSGFDGFNVPTKILAPWKIHAEFYVDLPVDRKPSLRDSALNEQSGSGINLFLGSDQVRFYLDRKEIAIDDVPAIVYSEVMRDVDLFTSVCAVGEDETWDDQGERGFGVLPSKGSFEELSSVLAMRAEMIARVLPLLPIADRCKIEKHWLRVQGKLGAYIIEMTTGLTFRTPESKFRVLRIPQKLIDSVPLDFTALPIDLDHRAESVLRKAHILANDWEITSPDLIQQL